MLSEEEVRKRLASIEADDRLHKKPANVTINAPLALIQVDLYASANALRWVLGMEPAKYGGEPVPEEAEHA